MKRNKLITVPVTCPHCGASLEVDYLPGDSLWYRCYRCCGTLTINDDFVTNHLDIQNLQQYVDHLQNQGDGLFDKLEHDWHDYSMSSDDVFYDSDDLPLDEIDEEEW